MAISCSLDRDAGSPAVIDADGGSTIAL